jgi:methionyl-tRNA formyltransferase
MSEGLDEGPIIAQLPFEIEENWTQIEYYQQAFALIGEKLANLIDDFATEKIHTQDQPAVSPTIIARRLSKDDSFMPWKNLEQLMNGQKIDQAEVLPNLFKDEEVKQLFKDKLSQIKLVSNASKAFFPWPSLWTLIPTDNGERRMKILSCHLEKERLILDEVQIEGKNPSKWNESKNTLI